MRYLLLDFCHSHLFEPCGRDVGVVRERTTTNVVSRCRLVEALSAALMNHECLLAWKFGVPCLSQRRLSERLCRPLALGITDVHVLQRSDLLEVLSVGLVRA